jgi:hypothetical protein
VGGHAPVGRHGQHITQTMAASGRPQSRVGAIDFVTGHPRRGNIRGHSSVDQCDGQGRFGSETPFVLGDSGIGAAVIVVGPAARKVNPGYEFAGMAQRLVTAKARRDAIPHR